MITKLNLLSAVMSSLFFLSCSNHSIDIGVSSTLSGKNSELGIHCRNGIILATEEINQSGILGKKQIRLFISDDKNSTDEAAKINTEFLNKGIKLIIGHSTSEMSKAGFSSISGKDALMISPSSSSDYFTDRDDNFIRVCSTTKSEAIAIADNIISAKLKKIAVIYDADNISYCESFINFFKEYAASKGINPFLIKGYSLSGNQEIEKAVDDVIKSNSDTVLALFSAHDLTGFIQKLRIKKTNIPVFTGGWAMTSYLTSNGGKAVEGIKAVLFYDTEIKTQSLLKFRKKYSERFGIEPTFSSIYGYDCVFLLYQSFRKNYFTPQEIKRNTIETRRFDSPAGDYLVNRYGDTQRSANLVEIKDGKIVKSK
ncbi:MAG: ABC transporter substrate-binding protein [Spirochaetes bacterium]|nr:ABC transporter substrate-binding protein [Spirochaetota bacterium]